MTISRLPRSLARECAAIVPLNPEKTAEARTRLNSLTKPRGSLGRLEDMAGQLYAIQEKAPILARPARMYTIAGDHGVVEEGIASSPQEVTSLMVLNFLRSGAGVNCLCDAAGADFRVVDAGVAADPFPAHPKLVNAKIARGSANMTKGPAMSGEQCARALDLGIELADTARREGIRVLGTGEMGIGNTTPSSALFCAYLGFSASEMTGMGAGVPPAGLEHKARVIGRALEVHQDSIAGGDPFAILAALGGFEIAALAGLIIGGAARRMAVMIDGFIATAAYVAASRLSPTVRDYCFFCHGSAEAGHYKVLERLGERPLLDLDMRLGEGTGAALGFTLLDAAARIYNDMATLENAAITL